MGRDYRVLICEFQLTRSRGAWHLIKGIALCQIIFQLTRSRGAWPQKNSPKAVIKIISTHTLTWSVTTAVLQLVRITKISTHTLTWSVTCIIDKTIRFVKFQLTRSRGAWPLEYSDSRGQTGNFNSHAHVERDLICLKSQKIIIHISTHTLTWSVTRFVNTAEVYLQFQLTRSRGAWLYRLGNF